MFMIYCNLPINGDCTDVWVIVILYQFSNWGQK